ncbi:universal stress protein [Acinetobacter pullicarnis]|uniref:universal stress protein n=1 Tax=Acinetobacter pullicarnis TaxID=2576829 RepID=UPI00111DC32B|nr:universal stress protein [Acinetobacter pullicarnis]
MAYQHILVPVDGSDTSLAVIQQAVELVKIFNAKITLVQVMTLDPYIAADYVTYGHNNELIQRARSFIQENIDKAKEKFQAEGVEPETRLLEGESIPLTIAKAVKELNVDLVVMSSHGRSGIKKLILGSVAQSLLSELEVPVLVVKAK